MKGISLIVLLALVSACQQVPVRDVNSPYFAVPLGSNIVLHKTLAIPAGKAGVFIQSGTVVRENDVDRYHANCKFEVRTVSGDAGQEIRPDGFSVYKVTQDTELVLAKPMVVAGLRLVSGEDGGPMAGIYATTMYLRSKSQSDVFRLTCQHWDDPVNGEHLTITQIRRALGEIMTLQLKL